MTLTLCLQDVLTKNESKIFASLPVLNWCKKKESLKLNIILKFKKVKLSKQGTCMCIEIGESN